MRFTIKHLLIILLVISGVATTAGTIIWFFSPAVPSGTLQKLTVGLPQAEAKKLLGEPRETMKFNWGNEPVVVWRYTSRFHSGLVDVFFSPDGQFKDYNYERF